MDSPQLTGRGPHGVHRSGRPGAFFRVRVRVQGPEMKVVTWVSFGFIWF